MTRLPVLDGVAAAAAHCAHCPKLCRYACPVATVTGRESATPWGIDRAIDAAARSGDVTAATAAAVYACTGCRGCGSACLPGLDLPTQVRAGRAAVVAAGLAPDGAAAAAGMAAAPAAALVAGATPGATTVVYAGCRADDGAALATLLVAANLAYDVVRAATCCGARSADVGLADLAADQHVTVAAALAAAKTVVVSDPHCARWLGLDQGDDRVAPLATYVAERLPRLRFAGPPEPVSWHDPCWLGRGLGVYDAPRALLAAAAGAPVVEPAHTRDHATCTGGGMGLPDTDPDAAEAILADRAAELAASGVRTVVTGCPTAAARLRAAGLAAHDLADYLAGRLRA